MFLQVSSHGATLFPSMVTYCVSFGGKAPSKSGFGHPVGMFFMTSTHSVGFEEAFSGTTKVFCQSHRGPGHHILIFKGLRHLPSCQVVRLCRTCTVTVVKTATGTATRLQEIANLNATHSKAKGVRTG